MSNKYTGIENMQLEFTVQAWFCMGWCLWFDFKKYILGQSWFVLGTQNKCGPTEHNDFGWPCEYSITDLPDHLTNDQASLGNLDWESRSQVVVKKQVMAT